MDEITDPKLHRQFLRLFAALRHVGWGTPGDLEGALLVLPPAGHLPPAPLAWLLLTLVRYWRRQEAIAALLAGMPPLAEADEADVPGLVGWRYRSYGEGHWAFRAEAEVDGALVGRAGACLDTMTLAGYVCGLADDPGLDRLREFDELGLFDPTVPPDGPGCLRGFSVRHIDEVPAVIRRLGAAGLVDLRGCPPVGEGTGFRLTVAAIRHAGEVDEFWRRWADPARRPWLAALIGDWEFAHAAYLGGGMAAAADLTRRRAERCRAERLELVGQIMHELGATAPTLRALDGLGIDGLPPWAVELRDWDCRDVRAKCRWLERLDDPSWCPDIYRIYRRVALGGPEPCEPIAERCAAFLARYGHAVAAGGIPPA